MATSDMQRQTAHSMEELLAPMLTSTLTRLPHVAASLADSEDVDVLRAALSDIWRRLQRLGDEIPDARKRRLEIISHELQASLLRREATAAELRGRKLDSSLEGRLLRELALRPRTPSELAKGTGVTQESVSRALARLTQQGAVSFTLDANDARRRNYRLDEAAQLTSAGEFQYADVTLYGDETRPDPGAVRAASAAYVAELIEGAVTTRRQLNDLDSSMAQLHSIVQTCVQGHFSELELWARRELATTQRQAGAREYPSQMRRLRAIAMGESKRLPRMAALPALGHYSYERGRYLHGARPDGAIRQLMTSVHTFQHLCDSDRDNREWRRWKAWAVYGAADALRQQTRLMPALEMADSAVRAFGDCDDLYGLAMSTFLAGFCIRLRGDFELADMVLAKAFQMTEQHHFDRLRAECLLQLGESHRSQGMFDTAAEELDAALADAGTLKHAVTRAFAHSSLGALAYERGELDTAVAEQEAALVEFDRLPHQKAGRALALRRLGLARFMAGREKKAALGDTERAYAELREAEAIFKSLTSPAGEIGCHVAGLQIRMEAGGNISTVQRGVTAIAKWFERKPENFRYVAQDLWAPWLVQRLMVDFNSSLLRPIAERLSLFADTERAIHDHERLHVVKELGVAVGPHGDAALPVRRDPAAEQMASESPIHVNQIPSVVV